MQSHAHQKIRKSRQSKGHVYTFSTCTREVRRNRKALGKSFMGAFNVHQKNANVSGYNEKLHL